MDTDVDTGTPDRPAAPELTATQRRAERLAAIFFGISVLAGIGLLILYFAGGQTQLEGLLFLFALGGLGIGIGIWGERLLGAREVSEDRHELTSGPAGRQALEEAFGAETGPMLRRRSFLLRMLVGAGGALGLALLLPVLSLGPAPGNTLKRTSWTKGTRLVTEDNQPILVNGLGADQYLTVFPEHHLDAADSVALLINVPRNELALPPAMMAGVAVDNICYSKLCTHAGCPVGLYRADSKTLFCPCHQSQFSVVDGGKPYFGPAARPLPQLPIGVDDSGHLVALADFDAPVGPAFWNRTKR